MAPANHPQEAETVSGGDPLFGGLGGTGFRFVKTFKTAGVINHDCQVWLKMETGFQMMVLKRILGTRSAEIDKQTNREKYVKSNN